MGIKEKQHKIIRANNVKISKVKTQTSKIHTRDGGSNMNANIQDLQKRLAKNMKKAVAIANKDVVRNAQGHILLKKDDEWRNEDDWDK